MAGPRVTLAEVEAEIVQEYCFTAEDGLVGALASTALANIKTHPAALASLTICVLILQNGTKLVGVNYGAIDPVQHDAERGRAEARKEAVNKVWELLGFRLRDRLAQEAS